MPNAEKPLVGIVMGSKSDWEPAMKEASIHLTKFGIPHEKRVMSAHRTPDIVKAYAETVRDRGIQVIIAAAGGAAHLAGVLAGKTDNVPVLGVPIESSDLKGMDSLLSTVQMPPGIPVGTLGIGKKGAINAAILAAQILSNAHPEILHALRKYREEMRQKIDLDDQEISLL